MTWKIRKMTKRGERTPPPLPMYERVVLKHVPTMVRRRYDDDTHLHHDSNNYQGLPSEDEKSDDDGVEDLDDSFEDTTHSGLDPKHDSQVFEENFGDNIIESSSCLKDCEDDGDIGAKDLTKYVEASVGNELHEVEQDCKSRGEGTEDENVASYYMHVSDQGESKGHGNFEDKQDTTCYYADTNVKDEVQDKEHGNSDEDKKVSFGKDSKKEGKAPNPLPMYEAVQLKHVPTIVVRRYDKDVHIDIGPENDEEKVDEAEDVNLASYLDTTMNYEAKHNEQGLLMENYKSEADGTKDAFAAITYKDSNVQNEVTNNDHGTSFDAEQDFLTIIERDGYDIYCPNCKHYITQTVILRRTEDPQLYQSTCFSFLTSLFCCNRW